MKTIPKNSNRKQRGKNARTRLHAISQLFLYRWYTIELFLVGMVSMILNQNLNISIDQFQSCFYSFGMCVCACVHVHALLMCASIWLIYKMCKQNKYILHISGLFDWICVGWLVWLFVVCFIRTGILPESPGKRNKQSNLCIFICLYHTSKWQHTCIRSHIHRCIVWYMWVKVVVMLWYGLADDSFV